MRYSVMRTIPETGISFGSIAQRDTRFGAWEGERRRAAAVQISAEQGLPGPRIQQACSGSLRLEINLEDFELVIHDRHVGVQSPYAAIGQTRQLELVGLVPGFTGAHPAVARWFDHVR